MELSAIVGNVRNYLLEDTEERNALRKRLMLNKESLNDESIMAYFADYNIPVFKDWDGEIAAPETLFEMYLRIRLIECKEMRQAWGVNLAYLEHIAAPGSLGISHARYMQLESNTTWFEMPSPDFKSQRSEH